MKKFDVVIIGGGLGGLLCGNILSREGWSVCVLEKNDKIGGCLQSFARHKSIFNTGLNYTEGLAPGQVLHKYFDFFGILDKLNIKRLDLNGFDVITYKGKAYKLAQGDRLFTETLSKEFPKEKEAIKTYIEQLRCICEQFPLYNFDLKDDTHIDYEQLFSVSAYEYIQSLTGDVALQNILAGNNLLYGGVKEKTPLYLHALILYSFIGSAWRLVNGSQHLATAIAHTITERNGVILRKSNVKQLVTEGKNIQYALLENGHKIEATHFISNIHPSNTLKLLKKNAFSNIFQRRVQSLENTTSFFSLYIVLKKNSFPYLNYNHYYYTNDNVWDTASYSPQNWPLGCLVYTPAQTGGFTYAKALIALAYMNFNEVEKWEDTYVEQRGDDYLAFKKQKAEQFINMLEKKFPRLRNCIETYYTSTPLTYRDYTGTPMGSAYGILKDFNEPYKTLVMPKTKIPNLLFTGQNLNVHGILGVSVGAVMTCGELIGHDYLRQKMAESSIQ